MARIPATAGSLPGLTEKVSPCRTIPPLARGGAGTGSVPSASVGGAPVAAGGRRRLAAPLDDSGRPGKGPGVSRTMRYRSEFLLPRHALIGATISR